MGSQDKSLQSVQYFTQIQLFSSNHISMDVPLVSTVNSSAHTEDGSVAGNTGDTNKQNQTTQENRHSTNPNLCAHTRGRGHFLPLWSSSPLANQEGISS